MPINDDFSRPAVTTAEQGAGPDSIVIDDGPYAGQNLTQIAKTQEGRDWLRATFLPKQQNDLAVIVEEDGVRKLRLSPHPGQRRALDSKARFVAVIAGSQSGKALHVNTPILTPTGFRKMADIHEGDCVYGTDGTPALVLAESPIFDDHDCYKITFDSGETIIADAEHQWTINDGVTFRTTDLVAILNVGGQIQIDASACIRELSSTIWWNVMQMHRPTAVVVSIAKTESVPVKCIAVDTPDHLYLCGLSCIPTHNTTLGPVWLFNEMQVKGPGDYLVVGPTFQLLEKKVVPAFERFFDKQMQYGSIIKTPVLRFVFKPEAEELLFGKFDPANPTIVYFAYADDPESLESMTVKAAWLDEAGQRKFRLGSWQAILRRLAINKGRALITTTPYDFGWLKTHIFDKYDDGDKDYDVINFRSTENPAFPQEEYDRAQANMPAWQFDLFYNGLFRRPAGMIYDSFDRKTAVIPRFEIPEEWDRILGIDFGGVNTAAVYFAEKPNSNDLYLYRRYKEGNRTGLEHCYYIQEGEPDFRLAVGGSKGEGQWRQEFRQGGTMKGKNVEGLNVRKPRVSDVKIGVMRVYGAFKRGEIFIFDDLVDVIDEIETYSREVGHDGQPTDEIDDKGSFHFCDCCRYVVSQVRGPSYESDTPLSKGLQEVRGNAELLIDMDERKKAALQAIADKKARDDARYRENEALDRARLRDPFDPTWDFR